MFGRDKHPGRETAVDIRRRRYRVLWRTLIPWGQSLCLLAAPQDIHSVTYYHITRMTNAYSLGARVGKSVSVPEMRCTACGAELILTRVIPDATMGRGFERHTFVCSACHLPAHRVVFTRHGREDDSAPIPVHVAPPTAPASKALEEHSAAPGILSRAFAKIRGH